MATPFLKVYDAFLARITADEWTLEEELAIVERDWQELLRMAIAQFKYPRVALDIEEVTPEGDEPCQLQNFQFVNELTDREIQMLALYMKYEWIKRCIASWENIRQLYASKDFSQANHLDKLLKLQSYVEHEIHKMEGKYDRSREYAPASIFKKLAGKKNV